MTNNRYLFYIERHLPLIPLWGFFILIPLSYIDMIETYIGIKYRGFHEQNPIMAFIINNYGFLYADLYYLTLIIGICSFFYFWYIGIEKLINFYPTKFFKKFFETYQVLIIFIYFGILCYWIVIISKNFLLIMV